VSSEKPVGPLETPLLRRQDFLGGAVVIAVAAVAFWLGSDLAIGTLGGMGPGMLPKTLAVALGLLGVALLVSSLKEGELIEFRSLRGPVFVIAALVLFGLTVRPLGLVVAGPLAILVSAFGSNEIKWIETVLSALLTSVFCVLLFKFALGLPIPLAPWLVGY
jgi:putative tricarboxylic transport membrane protein